MNLDYHFITRVRQQAKNLAHHTALSYKQAGKWIDISWTELQHKLDTCSKALLACGVEVQDKIAIFADNSPRWSIADIAALQIRAVTVPIYATNTAKQVEYILNDADVKILFVGNLQQLETALTVAENCPKLEKIVLMDWQNSPQNHPLVTHWQDFMAQDLEKYTPTLMERLDKRQMSDLFTLIYTSGTTGDPKGVMLDFANLAHQLQAHDQALPTIDSRDVSLSFLPLSHIFERAWVAYVLHRGAINCYLADSHEVRQALTEVKPSLMCAVPRLYEKIYTAVQDKVQKASLLRRAIFHTALFIGKKYQQNPTLWLKPFYRLADKLVLSKLRQLLGGKMRMMPCGGAKLEASIGQFFHSIGLNIKLGYGMTETTATVSCWQDGQFKADSIGKLMPNVEVKIGENDEILVRGGQVMRGYYKKPLETAQAFTEDGFLKTGDAGKLDEEGNLYITDRIKELMKTSTGKYIAPQYIEGKIGKDRFIEQVAVIADAKKYVSALIVPCFDALEEYAKQLNIKYQDRMELVKHSEVIKLFEKRLAELQKELANFEQIKKFTLLPQAFSTKMEEITPTLKLRRKVILERYQQQIDAMYR